MPNHFHFLVRQNNINGMKMFMHSLCTSYSNYFNRKYGRVGHIFQDVFKAKNVLDDAYLTQLTAYIHVNPDRPFTWKYSSMPVYTGKETDNFVEAETFMKMHNLTPDKYKNFLLKQYNPVVLEIANLLFEED